MGTRLAHEGKRRVVTFLVWIAGVRARPLDNRHRQIFDTADAAFSALAGIGGRDRVILLSQRDKKAVRRLS